MEDFKINSLHKEVLKKALKLIKKEYIEGKESFEKEEIDFKPNGIFNACVMLGTYFTCDDVCYEVISEEIDMLNDIYEITLSDPNSAIFHLNLKSYPCVENLAELIEYVENKLANIIMSN